MTTADVRVRVAECKQRDAGMGKVRVNDETMRALNIVAGDTVSIKGKRITAAVAWPAYHDDQQADIIRMDGLLRKNAGVTINDYVTVTKASVKEAKSIRLVPVDMRLNVDRDFTDFLKSRLFDVPMIQGDAIFVVILGSAIPFTVVRTEPKGIVKMGVTTSLHVEGHPKLSEEQRETMAKELRLYRFAWLKDVERKTASESTKFYVPEGVESDREDPVLNEAKRQAEETNQPVQVFVELWTTRGKIGSFPWSLVKPDGTIEYNYETDLRFMQGRFSENMDAVSLIVNALKDHEQRLDMIAHQLKRIVGKFESKEEA